MSGVDEFKRYYEEKIARLKADASNLYHIPDGVATLGEWGYILVDRQLCLAKKCTLRINKFLCDSFIVTLPEGLHYAHTNVFIVIHLGRGDKGVFADKITLLNKKLGHIKSYHSDNYVCLGDMKLRELDGITKQKLDDFYIRFVEQFEIVNLKSSYCRNWDTKSSEITRYIQEYQHKFEMAKICEGCKKTKGECVCTKKCENCGELDSELCDCVRCVACGYFDDVCSTCRRCSVCGCECEVIGDE